MIRVLHRRADARVSLSASRLRQVAMYLPSELTGRLVPMRERAGSPSSRDDVPSPATVAPAAEHVVRATSERVERFGRRSLRRAAHPESEDVSGSLAALRAELVMLRAENARLKIALQRNPDLASVTRLSRACRTSEFGDTGDGATQRMTEALVLRESLLGICREFEQATVGIRERLNDLVPAPDEPEKRQSGGDACSGDR